MQNDRQRCKIKAGKFLLDILWRFGVMEEKTLGMRIPPGPVWVKSGKLASMHEPNVENAVLVPLLMIISSTRQQHDV